MKKLVFSLMIMCAVALSFTACKNEQKSGEGTTATTTTEGATNSASTATPPPPPNEPQVDPNQPKTTVEFKEMEHDFGKHKEGEKLEHIFKFKNTGKEPLIIANAKGSCGCTVPQWPKEPVAPGTEGEIKVVFDSKGKPGQQSKTVTVTANTEPNPVRLTIKAEIEGDPNAKAAVQQVTAQPAGGAAPQIEVKKK